MIIYIHGFKSSSASRKSAQVRERLAREGRAHQFRARDLPFEPAAALALLEGDLAAVDGERVALIGSSLGGFYATVLAERHGLRAIVVNPAIDPHVGLAAYLGPQRNLYTGAEFVLAREHLDQLRDMYPERLTRPERYLLMHTTGDELLDYRIAMARYAGSRQIIVPGGDHAFLDFERWLDPVWEFAGLSTAR
jgi:uncharacterized protein